MMSKFGVWHFIINWLDTGIPPLLLVHDSCSFFYLFNHNNEW
jgi:hypothetical protein